MNTEVWATLSCLGYLKNPYAAFVSVVDFYCFPIIAILRWDFFLTFFIFVERCWWECFCQCCTRKPLWSPTSVSSCVAWKCCPWNFWSSGYRPGLQKVQCLEYLVFGVVLWLLVLVTPAVPRKLSCSHHTVSACRAFPGDLGVFCRPRLIKTSQPSQQAVKHEPQVSKLRQSGAELDFLLAVTRLHNRVPNEWRGAIGALYLWKWCCW